MTRRAALAMAVAGWALAACGGSSRDADGYGTDRDRWEGRLQTLFDDQIDPAALGLALDGRSAAEDPLLRERTVTSDVVSRMRVQTVDSHAVGARKSYQITLQVGQPTLMPAKLDDRTFELNITQQSTSFPMVESFGTRLRGKTFIGFFRKFAGAQGAEVHWHLSADAADVAKVIQEHAVLEEVAGQHP